jgi:hypothetical protein
VALSGSICRFRLVRDFAVSQAAQVGNDQHSTVRWSVIRLTREQEDKGNQGRPEKGPEERSEAISTARRPKSSLAFPDPAPSICMITPAASPGGEMFHPPQDRQNPVLSLQAARCSHGRGPSWTVRVFDCSAERSGQRSAISDQSGPVGLSVCRAVGHSDFGLHWSCATLRSSDPLRSTSGLRHSSLTGHWDFGIGHFSSLQSPACSLLASAFRLAPSAFPEPRTLTPPIKARSPPPAFRRPATRVMSPRARGRSRARTYRRAADPSARVL